MSPSVYAVRFEDGEIRYGYDPGHGILDPRLFSSPAEVWTAFPSKAAYQPLVPTPVETGVGERVQVTGTDAAWAHWATATREMLTLRMDQDADGYYDDDSFVHSFKVRFGPGRHDVEDWAARKD